MTLKDIIELETNLTHMFDSDQRVAMALLEYVRENKYKKIELEDGGYEIYEMIRNTFHSKSSYFLTKSESYNVMKVVKDIVETREK